MRFWMTVSEWGNVYTKWSSWLEGWSILSGSTATVINLSTTFTTDPTGHEFILTSGTNRGYGSSIVSYTKSGAYVDSVTLAEALPDAPAAGDWFILVDPSGATKYKSDAISVDLEVKELEVSSKIQGGFRDARIVARPRRTVDIDAEQYVWKDIAVYDPYGGLVWNGLSVNCATDGGDIEVTCVGYYDTFDYYNYETPWPQDPNTTTPAVLSGIISTNPYIYGTPSLIDPDGSLAAAQAAAGGIGPLKFDEERPTAMAAIEKVLSVGMLPVEATELFLLFWGPVCPEKKTFSRSVYTQARWGIDKSSVRKSDLSNLGVEYGVVGAETKAYVEYTVDNELLRTVAYYDPYDYAKHGRKERVYSIGEATEGYAQYILDAALPRRTLNFVGGGIVVGPYVRYNGGGTGQFPSWQIRAGDVIDVSNVYGRYDPAGGIFTVGEARFSYPRMETSLKAYTPKSLKEIVEQYLEI